MEHINNVMKYSSAILRVSLIRTESIFKSTSVAAPFRTSNRNAVKLGQHMFPWLSFTFVYMEFFRPLIVLYTLIPPHVGAEHFWMI